MNSSVEFLDEPPPHAARSSRQHTRTVAVVAVCGWVAAAVLTAVAPFQAVYTIELPTNRDPASTAVSVSGPDGWAQPGQVDFGVALCISAAIFALMAVLGTTRLLRNQSRQGLSIAAVGAFSWLAAIVLLLASYVANAPGAESSGSFAPVPASAYSPGRPGGSFPLAPGWCLWLALVGLACGALAALAQLGCSKPAGLVEESEH